MGRRSAEKANYRPAVEATRDARPGAGPALGR